MFKNILVPLDLTRKNHAALEIAKDLATQNNGKLTLLHVIEQVDFLSEAELKDFYQRLEQNARNIMEEFAYKLRQSGVSVETVILYGKRAKEIILYSIDQHIDLIVLSSHRVDSANPEDWGTISYKVAILSKCPILLVK
jgi:universal stress protein A